MSAKLARLLAAGPALESDAWSLDEPGLELILDQLDAGRVQVVECGSGRSTIVIARRLRELGRGRVDSLEHDPHWARLTARRIAAEGLGDRATVIEAPLSEHPAAAPGCLWYEAAALERLPAAGVELLVVDGPPAGEPRFERSRYPALPALADRLAPGAVVVLDDAGRPGERWVLERWEAEHGLRFDRREKDGVAIGCMLRPHSESGA
jgi:SAM-dependent methyltransferase